MSSALVLTGAPGAGKTAVLDALTTLLEIEGTSYGALESEQLARGWPMLGADQWLLQLESVIGLQREGGRQLFLVAVTAESPSELRRAVGAVGADQVMVVCLSASPDVVAARLATRESDIWPGKQALIAHARQLATLAPAPCSVDLVIDTEGRDPHSVAGEIRDELHERGVVLKR
jgi:gluconate kinase